MWSGQEGGWDISPSKTRPSSSREEQARRSNLIISDEHAAEFGRLIEAVHRAGGKIVIQLNHAGRQTSSKVTGSPIVGPSPLTWTKVNEIPRELYAGEIAAIAEAFRVAAQRVKNAGADGIELHMAHGYLICCFYVLLSPTEEATDMEVISRGGLALPAMFSMPCAAA